jgi:hypothetical protein
MKDIHLSAYGKLPEPLTPAVGLMTLNSDRGHFSNSPTDLMSERTRLR